MKAYISDRKYLQSITPGQITAYLRSKGGKQVDEFHGKATIWHYDGEELLVPLAMHFADYTTRILVLLQILEHKEGRPQYAIMSDMNNIGYDVIRIICKSNYAQGITPGLESCVDFLANARDMLKAAACSAATHKICCLERKVQKAEEYLKTVKFGQMEHDSFSLQLLSPVAPTLTDQLSETCESETNEKSYEKSYDESCVEICEESYERRVVPTLQSGLEAMNEVAQEASLGLDLAPFREAAKRGLTTNLCDAVCAMHETLNQQYIEVTISYSPNRRQPHKIARVIVDCSYLPIIKAASSKIKAHEPEPDQLIRGQVTEIESNAPNERGEIKIMDVMTAQPRVLSVFLDGDDYQKAIIAHQSRQLVEISGTVVKSDRILKLNPYSPFEIV